MGPPEAANGEIFKKRQCVKFDIYDCLLCINISTHR